MAGNGLPSLGRVKLTDLIPSEGIPSDSYKLSVSTLSQSFAQYSAAIIQFPASDGALLRSGLDSARLYFQQKAAYPPEELIHTNDSREWCKTSGTHQASSHLQLTLLLVGAHFQQGPLELMERNSFARPGKFYSSFTLSVSRLSYEQFSSFLANIKELNAQKQTRAETLRKAEEIFGIDNKDLFLSFQGLLNRNIH
ncbi:hypothetical protein Godav_000089 [Gossypium davidsonii]|uniref:At4g15545-like C-terminal domain-containing protein n=1 Tax=Gossypium davidsonii TaxID=34287 RepID=A0A7J8T9W1_GOSDV|nr:hypothetical protein [Gossypium davidsonii]